MGIAILGVTKLSISTLYEDSTFLIHSLNEVKEFNNNEKTRQEANNKKKGFQFKFSLPVVIDATDRSFSYSLNNEKTQGEILC